MAVNPHFTEWMRIRAELHGYTLGKFLDDEELPDICPNCGEHCELDGEAICGECERDSSRGKKSEEDSEEDETCEMCDGTGTIYVMRPNSWYGMMEVPIRCECRFPALLPYNVRMLAIEELSGLNEVQ